MSELIHRILLLAAAVMIGACELPHGPHTPGYGPPIQGPTARLSIPNRGFFDEVLLEAIPGLGHPSAGERRRLARVPNGHPPVTVAIPANQDFSFIAGARDDGGAWCLSRNTIHHVVPGDHYHVLLWRRGDGACVVDVVQGEPDQYIFEMRPVHFTSRPGLGDSEPD